MYLYVWMYGNTYIHIFACLYLCIDIYYVYTNTNQCMFIFGVYVYYVFKIFFYWSCYFKYKWHMDPLMLKLKCISRKPVRCTGKLLKMKLWRFFFWIQSLSLLWVQVNYFLETLNPFSTFHKKSTWNTKFDFRTPHNIGASDLIFFFGFFLHVYYITIKSIHEKIWAKRKSN